MNALTFLIVDDDVLYREALANYCKKFVHCVLEAENGSQAFQILCDQPVDGMITDLRMPTTTGIELLKLIRNRGQELARIPKIMVNTGIIEGGESYLKALGASQIYVKPADLKEITQNLINQIQSDV